MEQHLGRPVRQDLSLCSRTCSRTCSPTYSPPKPWITLGGGGHGDARLAQLVWLVLVSRPGRALRRGEDAAGRGHRKSRGRGRQRLCSWTHPCGPQTLIPNTPTPEGSLGAVWPSLRGQKSNLSIPHLLLSQTQESWLPHTASPPGLISQDSQLSVHVGPFSPRFFL